MSRFRCGIVLGLLAFGMGCSSADRPTSPSPFPREPVSTVDPPPPPPPFSVPPLTGPSTLYRFSGPLAYPVRHFTETSSYVLYDNGAFSLQYANGELVGAYLRQDDQISLRFGPRSDSTATGTLKGELLEVRYSEIMQHSDFEDAVYRRAQ